MRKFTNFDAKWVPSFCWCVGICFIFLSLSSRLLAGPLETAQSLAQLRFSGWTYGSDASKKQIDCVQFVLAVAEEEKRMTFGAEIRKAILISHGWSASETQTIAAAGQDPRLAGIQHGLATIGKVGDIVQPADAAVGDFIQYWMKQADGNWFGHSGVISALSNGRATIFGAHLSQGKIAESTYQLNLTGPDRLIYLLRLR